MKVNYFPFFVFIFNLTFNVVKCITVLEKGAQPLGDPPQKIADELYMAVLRDDKEDTPISFKFAYWLRVTCPAFFHFMMARRAEQAVNVPNGADNQRY